jgi:hypothetical protein
MRPVRFVALSEDGQAFVLADEVGRLLALPIDERVQTAIRTEPGHPSSSSSALASAGSEPVALSPRDIQARIRAGESADEVARVAGVPVDRVLRYAGPVLQERAMLAQQARRTKLKNSDKNSLAEVVDSRLAMHGVEAEKISWDAYRRDDGTWRIVATWPSGKATAQAIWDLDRTRQLVTPHDDMALYLCTERPSPVLGKESPLERPGRGLAAPTRGENSRGDLGRGGHEPIRPAADPAPVRREQRPGRGLGADPVREPVRDPIRSGRDALLASLDRPLTPAEPAALASGSRLADRPGSAFDEDADAPKEVPAVPSLAVLRPRRASTGTGGEPGTGGDKPRKRLPSWDDVLFGSAPARESS